MFFCRAETKNLMLANPTTNEVKTPAKMQNHGCEDASVENTSKHSTAQLATIIGIESKKENDNNDE